MIGNIISTQRFLPILLLSGILFADGPDGYGYTAVQDTDFNWIEISDSGTPLQLGDDDFVSLELPFFFPFYNHLLSKITIGSNGFLCDSSIYESRNYPLPYYNVDNMIVPFWIDLAPNQGGNVFVYGDSSIFIVEWSHVPVYLRSNGNTFEVILKPDGGVIFQYLHLDPQYTDSATVGVQGDYGQNGYCLLYSYKGTPHEIFDSLKINFLRPRFTHDVGIFNVEPGNNAIFHVSDSIVPLIKLRNYGQMVETVDVGLQISLNDSLLYTYEGQSEISPDNVSTHIFPCFHFRGSGKYNFYFHVHAMQDQETSNNSYERLFYCAESIETFEDSCGGFNPIPQIGWEWGSPQCGPDSALSGENLWGTILNGNYYDNSNMILDSPEYVATTSCPSFGFFHWYHMERRWDGGNILISTDFGRTWTIVYPDNGYPYQSIQALSYQPGFSGRSDGWEFVSFTIPLNKGQHVRIRLHFASGNGVNYEGWYIDNFWTIGLQPYTISHDVAPIRIVTPSGLVEPNSPIAVLGNVKNFGLSTDTFGVSLVIVDTSSHDTIFIGNTSTVAQPGESKSVSFGSVTLPDSSYFKVIMITNLTDDENPSNDTLISFARTGIDIGDLTNFLPLDPVTGDFQNLGVTTDGEYFYVTGGNRENDPNKLYVLDSTGFVYRVLHQPVQFTGWGWSDLTFDGTNFLASYRNFIYRITIDSNQINVLDSFEIPVVEIKAITVDRRTKTLYVTDSNNNIYCIDSLGNILANWSNTIYVQGITCDTTTGHLWLSVERADSNLIYEFDPTTGTMTGKYFYVPLPPGYNHESAGRMTFLVSPNGLKRLVELVQGDPYDYLAFIYLGQTGITEKNTFKTQNRIFYVYGIAPKEITGMTTKSCQLTILSADGRVIKKLNVRPGKFRISTKNLPDGVYFIRVETEKKTQIERFIILK